MLRNRWDEWNSDPDRWYLVPVQPGTIAMLRRWSVVCISLLALLVLGFLLIAVVPQKANSAAPANKAPLKIDANPAHNTAAYHR